MPRSDFSYTQAVIGDCGHQCNGWPVIADLGGANPKVVCEECTAKEYGIESEVTGIAVWVRIKTPPEKKVAKPKKPKAPKPSMWDQFLPGTK